MSSDRPPAAIDSGLLTPVSIGHDSLVSDTAVLDALVTVEVALWRAIDISRGGAAGASRRDARSAAWGWRSSGELCADHSVPLGAIVDASASGGNPVIPLVGELRRRGFDGVHEGTTSQDVLDSALMMIAARARSQVIDDLTAMEGALAAFAATHRDRVTVARTLTQHAVPTTVGLRAAGWLRGVRRAREALAARTLPAQLAGAGGTLAAWVDGLGADAAAELPAVFAAELGLAAPDGPWQVQRWPVTELGDALVQVIDAVAKMAADVATLGRTEVAELAEAQPGESSAMPHKRNPVASVLIRSAAVRAPQLGATLHLASALAVDERPDGAWHAEWPTLRELLRLALGTAANGVRLARGLRVDDTAVDRNLALSRGLIVAERLGAVPGLDVGAIVAQVHGGGDVGEQLVRLGVPDAERLADPADYLGLAKRFVDEATGPSGVSP